MLKTQATYLAVLLLILLCPVFASGQDDAKLRLFIHGGSSVPESSRETFVKMAGGENAHLVVIPTATSDSNLPDKARLDDTWAKFGLKKITVLHTRDPNVANDPEFLKPLDTATAVWISGGDQRRLADAYSQTAVEAKLRDMANRGIVVGGTSAGAAIQSRVMIQGGREEPDIGAGLNLLPNSIVDQHFLERSRLNRLARAVEAHPIRTGIGISESTSLVVEGDNAKVIGPGFVVSIRKIGEQLDIRSFDAGSTFELKKLNLIPQDLPAEVLGLPGTSELFANRDQLDDFLIKSATNADQFRQSFLVVDEFEPKALSLAKLVQRFIAAHEQRFAKDPSSKRTFPISVEHFMEGFEGTTEELDGVEIYAPFAGQWQGRWDQRTVDHHWSGLVKPEAPMNYRVSGTKTDSRFSISSYQYAWIGDGYGMNMVASENRDGKTSNYLLGYVEHLREGDFSQITARRPHVGIPAGKGRLVWVTEQEVFIEETFPGSTADKPESYSIIGFNFEIAGDTISAKDGFQTLYRRASTALAKDGLPEFESFNISIEEKRRRAQKN